MKDDTALKYLMNAKLCKVSKGFGIVMRMRTGSLQIEEYDFQDGFPTIHSLMQGLRTYLSRLKFSLQTRIFAKKEQETGKMQFC